MGEAAMDEKLVAACQMFLVPATILFGGLGVATTEALKSLLCLIGAVVSAAWLFRLPAQARRAPRGLRGAVGEAGAAIPEAGRQARAIPEKIPELADRAALRLCICKLITAATYFVSTPRVAGSPSSRCLR
jgi:hypothetical protein